MLESFAFTRWRVICCFRRCSPHGRWRSPDIRWRRGEMISRAGRRTRQLHRERKCPCHERYYAPPSEQGACRIDIGLSLYMRSSIAITTGGRAIAQRFQPLICRCWPPRIRARVPSDCHALGASFASFETCQASASEFRLCFACFGIGTIVVELLYRLYFATMSYSAIVMPAPRRTAPLLAGRPVVSPPPQPRSRRAAGRWSPPAGRREQPFAADAGRWSPMRSLDRRHDFRAPRAAGVDFAILRSVILPYPCHGDRHVEYAICHCCALSIVPASFSCTRFTMIATCEVPDCHVFRACWLHDFARHGLLGGARRTLLDWPLAFLAHWLYGRSHFRSSQLPHSSPRKGQYRVLRDHFERLFSLWASADVTVYRSRCRAITPFPFLIYTRMPRCSRAD